jgi:hypothetical protein
VPEKVRKSQPNRPLFCWTARSKTIDCRQHRSLWQLHQPVAQGPGQRCDCFRACLAASGACNPSDPARGRLVANPVLAASSLAPCCCHASAHVCHFLRRAGRASLRELPYANFLTNFLTQTSLRLQEEPTPFFSSHRAAHSVVVALLAFLLTSSFRSQTRWLLRLLACPCRAGCTSLTYTFRALLTCDFAAVLFDEAHSCAAGRAAAAVAAAAPALHADGMGDLPALVDDMSDCESDGTTLLFIGLLTCSLAHPVCVLFSCCVVGSAPS